MLLLFQHFILCRTYSFFGNLSFRSRFSTEYIRDFFEVGGQGAFPHTCDKLVRKLPLRSRLPRNASFYIVLFVGFRTRSSVLQRSFRAGLFFMNNLLFGRTADFRFYIAACLVAFSPANECTNIYLKAAAVSVNVQPLLHI